MMTMMTCKPLVARNEEWKMDAALDGMEINVPYIASSGPRHGTLLDIYHVFQHSFWN
jgi:hypothetical protein